MTRLATTMLLFGGLASLAVAGTAGALTAVLDAPELARLGDFAIGVRTLHLQEAAQPDVLAFDAASGKAPLRIREAAQMGFRRCIMPEANIDPSFAEAAAKSSASDRDDAGACELVGVRTVGEALDALL